MVRKTLAKADSTSESKAVVKTGSKSIAKSSPGIVLDMSSRKSISTPKPRGSRVAKGVMRKSRKSLSAPTSDATSFDKSPSDCIYLGHIPSGFGENEMRRFFAQFGTVKKLKLFRNKKSLASRGHAFIKFDSIGTASTVADAINGYFLGERQLVSHVVQKNKLHPGMFKLPRADNAQGEINKLCRKRNANDDDDDDDDDEEEENEVNKERGKDINESESSFNAVRSSANLRKKQKRLRDLGIEYEFLDNLGIAASSPKESEEPLKKSKKRK